METAIANLARVLGVDPSDNADEIEAAYFSGAIIPPSEWPSLAQTIALGGKNDCDQAERFARLPTLAGLERVETYLDIFCTSANSGRTPRKSIVSKAIGNAALAQRLLDEQVRVWTLLERRRGVTLRDRSAALLTVAYAVVTRYAKEKARRGLLDYDDLVDKALQLLANVEFGLGALQARPRHRSPARR